MAPIERSHQSLTIRALRGGTTGELIEFLTDLEHAYCSLYDFYSATDFRRWKFHPLWEETFRYRRRIDRKLIQPDYRLELVRVQINSPGVWEFLGSLNPLQQLREYLKDRHERRKDREYREQSEKERLHLENELLRNQIEESELGVLRSRVELLRDFGFSDTQIRQRLWEDVGQPLSQVGRHQDIGLIGGPLENRDSDNKENG